MVSPVQRLTGAFPPPAAPRAHDWRRVESRLGTRLPADYKELIDTYGGGWFDQAIWVLEPGSSLEHYDLLAENEGRMEAISRLWELGEPRPAELAAEDSRVIAWALTEDGEHLYWLVRPRQDPGSWTVLVKEGRGPHWEHHRMSCTEFLVSVLVTGDAESEIFDELPLDDHHFRSTSGFAVPDVP
ncbi:SMI1/KNR4 family protein [Streptomyces sp. MST-110588]|uniref:SMI1/KNR4 family protein n=1 Tax=Streptomyces sp. MST-110588 TaxID=2833628 RepID=UPI001F5C8766|nr:SMI1/KNR4 family protein [Streptomyces sp. MST-110588]UNO41935.1 SMI1/KNR4 family protein [Streptomyces sp. MST-110588]